MSDRGIDPGAVDMQGLFTLSYSPTLAVPESAFPSAGRSWNRRAGDCGRKPIVRKTFSKRADKHGRRDPDLPRYDSVCLVGADTFGTDTLKDGFVFESAAGPPLRSSISPTTVVGALAVAVLKIVTTIRFQGELS